MRPRAQSCVPEPARSSARTSRSPPGIFVGLPDDAAEQVVLNFEALSDRVGEIVPESGNAQGTSEIGKTMRAMG